jgi:hypothetical protein
LKTCASQRLFTYPIIKNSSIKNTSHRLERLFPDNSTEPINGESFMVILSDESGNTLDETEEVVGDYTPSDVDSRVPIQHVISLSDVLPSLSRSKGK